MVKLTMGEIILCTRGSARGHHAVVEPRTITTNEV